MAETISLEVLRYSPEHDAEPSFQRYDVPVHKDWVVELLAALELGFMLDVGSAIVESALHRTESRGAHQRTDFPARDDRNFLAHTLIFRNPDGSTRVEQAAVVITRWPPGERVYGVQSEVKEVAAR